MTDSHPVSTTQDSAVADDGTRLAYQYAGQGRPLLLLAGQANNHHWWDRVGGDFHEAHRTITMDYRGTGASGKPEGPYSTGLFAEDAIAVLDALGIEQADVYGTSMGGRTAQHLAARHPDRVRRLILGCTTPGGLQAFERDASVRRALAQRDPEAVREVLADLMYTPAWRTANPGPYTVLGDPGMPPHARGAHLIASNRHNAWDALPQIKAPTLILHGDQDRMAPPENAPLLADRIPDARVHLFPGARHAYFDERRAEAGALVRDFLA